MKCIKNVVFDLGNVLIRWDPRNLYRKIFSDPKEMELFLTTVCTANWNESTDYARSFDDAIAEILPRYPHYERQILDYKTRWEEMLGGQIDETAEILMTLKRRGTYRLFALSNWSKETFPIAQQKFTFLKEFDGLVVSGYVGMMKPDPLIFKHLCEAHGLVPEESFFIDDVQKNIEAAAGLGFQTHHFHNPARLRADLIERGVLS
ncbi:MAG: HAD family hydrolase [Pseudobdellovibrionaceae bacterium]